MTYPPTCVESTVEGRDSRWRGQELAHRVLPRKKIYLKKKTSLNFHSKASEPNPRAEYTFRKNFLFNIPYSLGPGGGG